MEELEKIKSNFYSNLGKIDQLVSLGSDIAEIALGLLRALRNKSDEIDGHLPFKVILENNIKVVESIQDHPQLKEKYSILYNQALVLVVANFESFMSDLFKTLINYYAHMIKWPDKKTIPVDTSLLQYSSPTVGDLVVKSFKNEVNFQDLQSTKRFLESYISVDVKISTDEIILFQALRNVIVHNTGKIDHSFLKQIRGTKYSKNYSHNETISLSSKEYDTCKKAFSEFADQIIDKLKEKEF